MPRASRTAPGRRPGAEAGLGPLAEQRRRGLCQRVATNAPTGKPKRGIMNGSSDFVAERVAADSSPINCRYWLLLALAAVLTTATGVHAQQLQNWPADDNEGSYNAPADGYAPQAQGYPQQGSAQQPISPSDLTQLVAPIALYPDTLVAEVLAASTYPAQVSAAAQWVQSMGNAPAEQIAASANAQTSWDPSVKALTAFPQVLAWMAQNMQWTTALGNAYYNQPQDVMDTIQAMRQRAQDAGTLQSTPQQQVYDDQGAVTIAPADPEVVYVPTYDPWTVYGAPIAPYPGFAYFGPSYGGFFGFGPAVFLRSWLGWSWGWAGWCLDWLGHSILFHNGFYSSHSYSVHDWGFPYGGPRWHGGGWGRGGNYARSPGYNNGGLRPRGGPEQGSGGARMAEGFNRGFPASGAVRGRDSMIANNHAPQMFSHPQSPQASYGNTLGQTAGRPSYGSGMMAQPRNGYVQRPGGTMSFANPGRAPQIGGGAAQNMMRAPVGGYGSYGGSYGGRMQSFSSVPRGSYSAPSQPRSFAYGGSPSFGGRSYSAPQASRSFGGGGHGFSGGRSFSSGGGGHSFSGGGGHSFSGGHSHGGGHSSGGGHHR